MPRIGSVNQDWYIRAPSFARGKVSHSHGVKVQQYAIYCGPFRRRRKRDFLGFGKITEIVLIKPQPFLAEFDASR